MARRFGLLVIMAGTVLLVCSAVAFAAVRTGNEGDNTLMGTRYKDSITGKGGDDRTVGKGGNDTYSYADGWGNDTVVDSGGTDTLNFSAVTGGVTVILCSPVEVDDGMSSGPDANTVTSTSRIENARGSLGNDIIGGCGGKNTLSGGGYQPEREMGPFPGEGDLLLDGGGLSLHGIPASNDVYLGSIEGSATVVDTGGGADVLDLRGFHSSNAEILSWDADGDGTMGSLAVFYGTGEFSYGMILLANQFEGDDYRFFYEAVDGRIEQIKFKNKTVDVTPGSFEPASAQQSAAIEEKLPDDLGKGSLLP